MQKMTAVISFSTLKYQYQPQKQVLVGDKQSFLKI